MSHPSVGGGEPWIIREAFFADRRAQRPPLTVRLDGNDERLAAGATQLDTLAGVLRLASACVSNDSGAMHLAGAVGVPLAALFGPTRERETSPLSGIGGRTEVLINHVWCRPCMLRECPLDHRCMNGLSPARVVRTLGDLMTNPES